MDRTELLAFVIHEVCRPVVEAAIQDFEENQEETVEIVSGLLEKSIQLSVYIYEALDTNEQQNIDVSLRLHVVSLCCGLITKYYTQSREMPTDAVLKKFSAAFDASLIFSENYIAQRKLSDVYPDNVGHQGSVLRDVLGVRYIEMMAPLVNCICEFSFGIASPKMIQNVSNKINMTAERFVSVLYQETVHVNQDKHQETLRCVAKSLIDIYISCHNYEKSRILELSAVQLEAESSEQQIARIWEVFDLRADILLNLLSNMLPEDAAGDQAPEQNLDMQQNAEFLVQGDDLKSLDALLDSAPDVFEEKAENQSGGGLDPMSYYKKSDG